MIKRIGQHQDNEINALADDLLKNIGARFESEAFLYVGYPIYIDEITRNRIHIDMLLLSEHGIFIVNILKNEVTSYKDIQDIIYNKMEIKLKRYPFLVEERRLRFEPILVTLQISGENKEIEKYPLVKNINLLANFILENSKNHYDKKLLANIISGFQEAYGINTRTESRDILLPDSKAYAIAKLEKIIETYDPYQMEAILSDPKGIQRIRGMAGSGKTVVLARKAVELHTSHPEWTIVVTYYTRSLKRQLHNLICRFYSAKNDGRSPDFSKLKLMHAWGSEKASGVYYEICKQHDKISLWYDIAKQKFGAKEAFSGICDELIQQIKQFKSMYDCIIIDEAQDFNCSFLKMCFEVLTPEKRLVYAYDELQNLGDVAMPAPKEIFGVDVKQDTPLTVCYRNQKNIIVSAHAIGMGLYRKEGLIQIPGSQDVWNAIGYSSDKEIKDNEDVRLYRTKETSPDFLDAKGSELINVHSYDHEESQYNALHTMLEENITKDNLQPKHIMIIDMDDIGSTNNRLKLMKYKINNEISSQKFKTHLAGTTSPEDFIRSDSIVYSSIYRAKGNEAFFVYIVNAQKCINSLSSARDRNSLFTAITRSKGWVSILGYGDGIKQLSDEFNRIVEENFTLHFYEYPDEGKRQQLIINNKDITEIEQKQIEEMKSLIKKYKEMTPMILKEILEVDSIDQIYKLLDKPEEKN